MVLSRRAVASWTFCLIVVASVETFDTGAEEGPSDVMIQSNNPQLLQPVVNASKEVLFMPLHNSPKIFL